MPSQTSLILRRREAPSRRTHASPCSGLIRDPAYGADLGEFAAQLFPGIAGIIGREELAVMAARNDEAGVCGMRREVPDRRIGLRRERQHLPAPPAVLRALDRAGITRGSVSGRDEQRSRVVGFLRQMAAVAQRKLITHHERIPVIAAIPARKNLARG